MRLGFRFVVLMILWCASVAVSATYSFVPNISRRPLDVTRNYEFELTAGKKNTVYLPATMSFYGATNEQEIVSSEFEYSVNPDSVTIAADDLEMPRKYYCLTWNEAPAGLIKVQQKMKVNLMCRSKLCTTAAYPYEPKVVEPFGDYLKDDPKGRVVVSDEALDPICEEILKKNPASAEDVVELVCDWINDNIKFGMVGGSSRKVLKEHTGHCEGMALLATAIVRKLGIPADTIISKFLNSPDGRHHGYMEVYFPDAGWVFYDLSNWQRGFKIPNCLATAGRHYRIEVEGQSEPRWVKGYFCREEDVAKYKKPAKIPFLPIRTTPETKDVYGVKVFAKPVPKSIRVRRRPLRDLLLDTSVEPGVRPYSP